MTQHELTELNLGQSLDDLANLDPRGYGVCKTLYKASRKHAGGPTSMNAAKKLVKTLSCGDVVYILTGFVLRPFNKAEMDGIVSSMLLCRALEKAFGAKPVVVCPEDNRAAVENMSKLIGLRLFEDIGTIKDTPSSMGVVYFTKDEEKASAQSEELISKLIPKAVIAVECPGANSLGVYHNAVGLEVTKLEAKTDILFEKLQELGILNIAIGDLGNEIGMGSVLKDIIEDVPYIGRGKCSCGCNGGIAARTCADNVITATVSDWGCYAMIAAMAFLLERIDVMHTSEFEKEAIICASKSGMIDMYGEQIPAVDGFGLEINLPIVALMRELVVSTLSLKEKCKTWFEKTLELGCFERSINE